MFHVVEVVDTKSAFKTGQKDEKGNILFDGSILVRTGGVDSILGQIKNIWCAPATFNKRIPFIGEQVLMFEAPGTEASGKDFKTKRFYYFTPYNTINNVTTQHFPLFWDRDKTTPPKGSKPAATVIADKKELGYTVQKKIRTTRQLQPFEGDDIWEGRLGQSIRFSHTYGNVNTPGPRIYEIDSKNNWPSSVIHDPIMILKVKRPSPGSGYDIEDISKDQSSIYLTTSQKLQKFLPGSTNNCDVKGIPNWNNGSQIVVDSDRVVINAKKSNAFLVSKTKAIVSAKKILLQTDKYHVDIDDLMAWLQRFIYLFNQVTSGESPLTTAMGPTGPSKNAPDVLKHGKVEYKLKFKKRGCGPVRPGGPNVPGINQLKNSAAASLSSAAASGPAGPIRNAILNLVNQTTPSSLAANAASALASAAGIEGASTPSAAAASPPASDKDFVTTAEAGLATRNGKQFNSPISSDLAKRLKSFQESLPPGTEQVITDTNDTGIHRSIAQKTGRSVDVNFKNFNPTPDKIATVIAEGQKNGLKLEYEVATKEEADAIYKAQPSLRGSGQVKVVKYITAPHFSVYMA